MSEKISRVFAKELKSTKLSVWLTWELTHEDGEHQREPVLESKEGWDPGDCEAGQCWFAQKAVIIVAQPARACSNRFLDSAPCWSLSNGVGKIHVLVMGTVGVWIQDVDWVRRSLWSLSDLRHRRRRRSRKNERGKGEKRGTTKVG